MLHRNSKRQLRWRRYPYHKRVNTTKNKPRGLQNENQVLDVWLVSPSIYKARKMDISHLSLLLTKNQSIMKNVLTHFRWNPVKNHKKFNLKTEKHHHITSHNGGHLTTSVALLNKINMFIIGIKLWQVIRPKFMNQVNKIKGIIMFVFYTTEKWYGMV